MRLLRSTVLILLVSACGSAAVAVPSVPVKPALTSTTTTAVPEPGPERPMYQGLEPSVLPEGMTLVAMAKGETVVYADPDDSEPMVTLPETTILGTTTVLTVLEGPTDGWVRVMLPVRPNGSEGWIQVEQADLFVVEGRVVVDLSDRTITVYRGENVVLTSEVAIGTDRNPTPMGLFFVTDSVTITDPGSPWGPNALGLSARSDTITEFNGGDGIIGIHGTNRPGSIGNAASLGCVRLPNDVIPLVHALVPIGTPVEIIA